MFPKAHAAAYVLMALRIAYFKVHHPIFYYSAYFSVRASDFDLLTMTKGSASIRAQIQEINAKGLDASPKEKNLLTVLEISLEMYERGFSIANLICINRMHQHLSLMGIPLFHRSIQFHHLVQTLRIQLLKQGKMASFCQKKIFNNEDVFLKQLLSIWIHLAVLEGMPEANQLSLF